VQKQSLENRAIEREREKLRANPGCDGWEGEERDCVSETFEAYSERERARSTFVYLDGRSAGVHPRTCVEQGRVKG